MYFYIPSTVSNTFLVENVWLVARISSLWKKFFIVWTILLVACWLLLVKESSVLSVLVSLKLIASILEQQLFLLFYKISSLGPGSFIPKVAKQRLGGILILNVIPTHLASEMWNQTCMKNCLLNADDVCSLYIVNRCDFSARFARQDQVKDLVKLFFLPRHESFFVDNVSLDEQAYGLIVFFPW